MREEARGPAGWAGMWASRAALGAPPALARLLSGVGLRQRRHPGHPRMLDSGSGHPPFSSVGCTFPRVGVPLSALQFYRRW